MYVSCNRGNNLIFTTHFQSTKAKIKAVMNDTVGQLAAASYKYGSECCIGVVIGYGLVFDYLVSDFPFVNFLFRCNSSYLEETAKITKFDAKTANYKHENMVIVTEWEEFGSKGELADILTSFDKEIDDSSVHQGKQMYEVF